MDANSGTPHLVNRIRRRRYLRRRRTRRLDLARSNSETTVRASSAIVSFTTLPTTTSPSECNNNTTQLTAPQSESTSHCLNPSSSNEADGSPSTSWIDQPQSLSAATPETIIEEPTTLPVNPVRVLFRDQQQQSGQQLTNQLATTNTTTSRNHLSINLRGSVSSPQIASPPIVNASRRLIERQIEAIQRADSNRWNFDFQNCRPLAQTGHRYVHCAPETSRNCRPLNDQNQSVATRLNMDQQRCRSPASQSDCQHRSDHKQQKDG